MCLTLLLATASQRHVYEIFTSYKMEHSHGFRRVFVSGVTTALFLVDWASRIKHMASAKFRSYFMWDIIMGWDKDEVHGTRSKVEKKIDGVNAVVPLDFLRSVVRVLVPLLQFVTKRWLWTLKLCTRCSNVSFILGNTNI